MTPSAAYNHRIGCYHRAQPYRTEKENQALLNALSQTPTIGKQNGTWAMLNMLTLLALVSNSVYAPPEDHNPGRETNRPPLAEGFPTQLPLLSTLNFATSAIDNPHNLALSGYATAAVGVLHNLLGQIANTLKNYDMTLLPGASAYIIPPTRLPTPFSSTVKDDVKIKKIDFSCAEQRQTMTWSQSIRQIGKTLQNPVAMLTNESKIIHHFNILKAGCPSEAEVEKVTAAAQRVDNVLSTTMQLIPYANPLVVAKNIVGPLLQLIADDIEHRTVNEEQLNDVLEQILFLAKSTVAFSPADDEGRKRADKLTVPDGIYSENSKIFTTIDDKKWQLIVQEDRFLALRKGKMHEITYSPAEKRWVLPPERRTPVTGVLLQRLHQRGHDGFTQVGGLQNLAKIYQVNPDELGTFINEDARLSAEGLQRIERVQKNAPVSGQRTLDAFYDAQERAARKAPPTAVEPPRQQVLSKVITPGVAVKIEEKPLKSDSPEPQSSKTKPGSAPAPPQRLSVPLRNKLKQLLQDIGEKGPQPIKDAGGLRLIAQQKDISLQTLRRYLRPNGSLTPRGTRLLGHRAKKNPVPPSDELSVAHNQGAVIPDADVEILNAHRTIAPHNGILALIETRKNTGYTTDLFGKVEGILSPLVYNLEQDVFYVAERRSEGEWVRHTDTPYIAKEGDHALSVLPENERGRTVTQAQRVAALKAMGSDLDLIRLEKHLAETPERTEVPHKISSIWVGNKRIPPHLINNLAHNAKLATSGANPYTFTLYLSQRAKSAFTHNVTQLRQQAPGVTIVTLESTAFYQQFKRSKYYAQYRAAINGNNGVATNFASASDVVRYQLLKHEGGIYMDTDDQLTMPPERIPMKATATGFILHTPMHNERLGMQYQYPTSIFASHPENPRLESVSEEIYTRYQQNKDIYQFKPAVEDIDKFNTYAKRLSYISGPDVFDAVIRQSCFDENQVLEAYKLFMFPLDRVSSGSIHHIFTALYHSDVIKITNLVTVGSENSWSHSKK